jgi:predicted dienelactone hydrolase
MCISACSDNATPALSIEVEPFGIGPYSVGSTNMEVADEYAEIGDEAMHEYLLGRAEKPDQPHYIADLLKYPESAWIDDVRVPDEAALYGPASGLTLPVVTFLTYPTREKERQNRYEFPYYDAMYGVFENMLSAGEVPDFPEPNERYPLIILAHGSEAHGIYDVDHAHSLASHGYIVAVINYGDDRTAVPGTLNHHVKFLRPFLTKAVLDSLLESESFGAHIDTDNIGITGHSFGGFTALAASGGPILGNTASVRDPRIKAISVAAPWVGGHYDGSEFYAFGYNNSGLDQVSVPTICFFGTNDEDTLASFILPASKRLSGPTYVVELVDQPHIFEGGSWEDRNNWELLFFSAYLRHDPASLTTLGTARSMKGGNEDLQLLDYQRLTRKRLTRND